MNVAVRIHAPGVRPTVGDLRRARDTLISAGDPSAINVAAALASILRGDDAISALGLKGTAGRRSALTVSRIATRDDLLRRMAARHYLGMSASAQAREIAAAARAYWRRASRLNLDVDVMPLKYTATPQEFLFLIAQLPATVPSDRTIRAILSS